MPSATPIAKAYLFFRLGRVLRGRKKPQRWREGITSSGRRQQASLGQLAPLGLTSAMLQLAGLSLRANRGSRVCVFTAVQCYVVVGFELNILKIKV